MQSKAILLVEDDVIIRETMKDLLEMEGYRIMEAGNGKIALDILKRDELPGLILLDMKMPILDGRGFLDLKLLDENIVHLPVIVISATADSSLLHGSNDFLRKPLDIDRLLSLVAEYI